MMKVAARWVLLAVVACILAAPLLHADLIAAFDNNGNPIAPGQSANLPAGGHWAFFKNPAMDLFYQIWVVPPPPVPPPPPPPRTYRVVQPNGTVYDLGEGTKPKIKSAKQKGQDVVVTYSDNGDTLTIPGRLLNPGEPDPAPGGGLQGMLDGPEDFLAPAEALADTKVFLSQFSDLFPTPLDLSFFQYDFSGTAPLPVFQRQETFSSTDGFKTAIGITAAPEPGSLALVGTALLLACFVTKSSARVESHRRVALFPIETRKIASISGPVILGMALITTSVTARADDPCVGTLAVSPTTIQFNANGAQLSTFTVVADPGCGWFFKYLGGDVVFTSDPSPNPFFMGSVTFGPAIDPLGVNACDAAGICGIVNHLARALIGQFTVASVGSDFTSATSTATQDPGLTTTWSCRPDPAQPASSRCDGNTGTPFSARVVPTGGQPTYIFSTCNPHDASCSFPSNYLGSADLGLRFDTSTGTLSGTPTAAGSFLPLVIWVKDADSAVNAAAANIVIGGGCTATIDGPADVPGLSRYAYAIHLAAGETASSISWTADKATASFVGANNNAEALLQFQNTQADFITVRADFTSNGRSQCAEKQVALVQVQVGKAEFSRPGKPSDGGNDRAVFLVQPVVRPYNPPETGNGEKCPVKEAPPADSLKPFWVTELIPTDLPDAGSHWECFKSNLIRQDREPAKNVSSENAAVRCGPDGHKFTCPAFQAESEVKLISPAEKPDAQQQIQVGFIQHGAHSGFGEYRPDLLRIIQTATAAVPATLDWLTAASGPAANDQWPWYDAPGDRFPGCGSDQQPVYSTATGSGTASWKQTLCMNDSPRVAIPTQYNPNDGGDLNATAPLTAAADQDQFIISIGARTLDPDLHADTHYFAEANSVWSALFVEWVPGISSVHTRSKWDIPTAPSDIEVHVVPSIVNATAPYKRWKCASRSCGY